MRELFSFHAALSTKPNRSFFYFISTQTAQCRYECSPFHTPEPQLRIKHMQKSKPKQEKGIYSFICCLQPAFGICLFHYWMVSLNFFFPQFFSLSSFSDTLLCVVCLCACMYSMCVGDSLAAIKHEILNGDALWCRLMIFKTRCNLHILVLFSVDLQWKLPRKKKKIDWMQPLRVAILSKACFLWFIAGLFATE